MAINLSAASQRRITMAVLGLGAALSLASAVSASERIDVVTGESADSVTRTTHVRVSDLNLSDPAATRMLENQIKVAAGQVCGKNSLWTLRPPADYTNCVNAAQAGAHAQLAQRIASGDASPIAVSMR